MPRAPDDFSAFRFSTDDFPIRDRDEAFREIYGLAIMRLDLEPKPDIPVAIDMELRALPDFGMASGTCSQLICRRSPRLIDSDDLILVIARSGGGEVQAGGRSTEIRSGEAMLTDGAEAGTFDVRPMSNLINFRLALNRLSPLVGDLNSIMMQAVPGDSEAQRLLVSYVVSLQGDLSLAQPELKTLAVSHIYDLAAVALGATRDAAIVAGGRGVRAARLRAIKPDIVSGLGERDVTSSGLAARHGVTPRYITMLFETETETLSEYILRQRLIRAHRMLVDARYAGRNVSSIAYDVGFGDVSYFNRAFRRLYGATPSDVRMEALRGGGA